MARALMPAWMQSIATYNPVEWAVVAGREGLSSGADRSVVLSRMAWLLVFTLACGWLATAAFRVYQRSI